MATATYTPIDLFTELFRRWPFMGFAATADSFAAAYVANTAAYGNSGDSENDHIDRYIYRYLLSGAERVKETGVMNSTLGQLAITSNTPYTTTGAGGVYMETAMHPDDMLAALQDAMRNLPENKTVPLGIGHDFDMELSGTDYWGGAGLLGSSSKSNCNVSKVTTEDLVNWGEQALKVALTSAAGYSRGEAIRVTPGATYYLTPSVRVEAGAVTPRIWDKTNSAYIDTANDVSYSGSEWAVLERTLTVPATCNEIQPQLQGTLISSVFYCDGYFGPYYAGLRQVPRLPTWMDESYKLRIVRPASFGQAIAGVAGAKAADSRYWSGDLQRGVDFDIEIQRRAANPNRLNFRNTENVQDVMGKEALFLMGERTAYDSEPMLTETSPTSQPFDLVMAYFMHHIALKGLELKPKSSAWERRVAETKMTDAQEFVPREIAVASQPVKVTHTRLVRA